MPKTKKHPNNSRNYGNLYEHSEYIGIYGNTIGLTTIIMDENYQVYCDFFNTDPMNSLCRRYQTQITKIKKNKKFTEYLL